MSLCFNDKSRQDGPNSFGRQIRQLGELPLKKCTFNVPGHSKSLQQTKSALLRSYCLVLYIPD